MISQRHFHVHIGNKKSRCRTLINGVLQGYVLAPALFNLYTYDLPETQSLFTLTTLLYFIVTLFSESKLSSQRANYKLQVRTRGQLIPFERSPKYLSVTLDRTLSFKQHLFNTAAKTFKRCSLIRRLVGNHWGMDFTTLKTTTLALCFSVAEYCSSVWCHPSQWMYQIYTV